MSKEKRREAAALNIVRKLPGKSRVQVIAAMVEEMIPTRLAQVLDITRRELDNKVKLIEKETAK